MALPALLGLLGLAGGALGQDWYLADEAKKGQAALRGLLGSAPDPVPDGGYANPTPGSGLMADPSNTQRQLEFMAGVMGLRPRDRAAARSLIEPILGRASQERVTKEGWGFQAGENRLSRDQAEAHYQGTSARLAAEFETSHRLAVDQFQFNREKFGDEFAFRQFDAERQYALARQQAATAAANAALQRRIHEIDLAQKLGGPKLELPKGYRGVMLPTGVPADAPLGPGIMGPVRTDPGEFRAVPIMGTPDWTKGQEGVDAVNFSQQNVAAYLEHMKKYGFQKTGELAGTQKQLYERATEAVRVLKGTGVLNVGEIPLLRAEMPDPTEVFKSPSSEGAVRSQLVGLMETLGRQDRLLRDRYRGWNLKYYEKPADAGRARPPTGSVEVDAGAYGGRGSGR